MSLADHHSTVSGWRNWADRRGRRDRDEPGERYDVVAYAVERRAVARRRRPVRLGFWVGVVLTGAGSLAAGEPVLGATAFVGLLVARAVALERRAPDPYRTEYRAVPAGQGATLAEAFVAGRESARQLRRLGAGVALLLPTLLALAAGRELRAVVYLGTVALALVAPVDVLPARPPPRLDATGLTEREVEAAYDAVRWPDRDDEWDVSLAELE